MFIPVAKTTSSVFVVCFGRQSEFEVSKKEFSHINNNQDLNFRTNCFRKADEAYGDFKYAVLEDGNVEISKYIAIINNS